MRAVPRSADTRARQTAPRPGSRARRRLLVLICLIVLGAVGTANAQAQTADTTDTAASVLGPIAQRVTNDVGLPFLNVQVGEAQGNQGVAATLQLILLLAVFSLAPSILLLTTSFLRIAVVFDFIKRALSLQQVPPTQVLLGISLFLTVFIMWPTFETIYEDAFVPFAAEEIGFDELYQRTEAPMRDFMYRQMDPDFDSIATFMSIRGLPQPQTRADVPTYVLIPAFVLHELTVAFKIGILLYIPFIVIDLVVSSTLMSMGMIMLPPIMISMPFKLILFVLVDGWGLLTEQVIRSFG